MTNGQTPSVFVLMPFASAFNDIYKNLIKEPLERVGFTVVRADDILSQQNILRDIIDSIANSDLIIADLTDINPNVFYELGIAHALDKPVLLLTQDIAEVPFDLKSYRILEYSTHFSQFAGAQSAIEKYGKGFIDGTIIFGSPIKDFHSNTRQFTAAVSANVDLDDDRGLLDHLDALESGYQRIADLLENMTVEMNAINPASKRLASSFESTKSNQNSSSTSFLRKESAKFAEQINKFANALKSANTEYDTVARETDTSFEFIVSFKTNLSESERTALEEQLNQIRELHKTAQGASESLAGMLESIDNLPRLERRFNRAITETSRELKTMIGHIDQTVASTSRAVEVGDRLLEQQ